MTSASLQHFQWLFVGVKFRIFYPSFNPGGRVAERTVWCVDIPVLVYIVWYVRENHDISVNCTPSYGEKYAEARYIWHDHLGHGAARTDFVLYGNGTMLIPSAQLTNSDTYRCRVDLPEDVSEVYAHSIIGKQPFFMTLILFKLTLNHLVNSSNVAVITCFVFVHVCRTFNTLCVLWQTLITYWDVTCAAAELYTDNCSHWIVEMCIGRWAKFTEVLCCGGATAMPG